MVKRWIAAGILGASLLALPLAADSPKLKEMRREIAMVEGEVEVLSEALVKNLSAGYQLESAHSEIESTSREIAHLKGRLDGSVPPPPPDKQCTNNLKALGTAVEMWSVKNAGRRYPPSLDQLSKSDIKYFVRCPEGKDYLYARSGDSYRLECPGSHGFTYSGLAGLGSR